MTQRCLPRPISDHSPILLDNEEVKISPSPFRFKLMWLKFEDFKEILKGWWQGLKFHGSFSFTLAAKLKALKGILKAWNKDVCGRVELKKEALHRVSLWDDLERKGSWSSRRLSKELRSKMILRDGLSWRKSPESEIQRDLTERRG